MANGIGRGRWMGILEANRLAEGDSRFIENARQFNANREQDLNRLKLARDQFDANNNAETERMRLNADLQNRNMEIQNKRYNDEIARQTATEARNNELFNRFTLPQEEEKLARLNDEKRQRVQSMDAYNATHARYDKEGLTDLVIGLESGKDQNKLFSKFNSTGNTLGQSAKKTSNGGWEIFHNGSSVGVISPEVTQSILSRALGQDIRKDGTVSRTSTAKAANENPDQIAKARKVYEDAIDQQKYILDDPESTKEAKLIANAKIIRNQKYLDELGGGTSSAPQEQAAPKQPVAPVKDVSSAVPQNTIGNGRTFDEQLKTSKMFSDLEMKTINANPNYQKAFAMINSLPEDNPDKATALNMLREKMNKPVESAKSPAPTQTPVQAKTPEPIAPEVTRQEGKTVNKFKYALTPDPLPKEGIPGLDPYYADTLADLQKKIISANPKEQAIIADQIIELKQKKIDALKNNAGRQRVQGINAFAEMGKDVRRGITAIQNYPSPFVDMNN